MRCAVVLIVVALLVLVLAMWLEYFYGVPTKRTAFQEFTLVRCISA